MTSPFRPTTTLLLSVALGAAALACSEAADDGGTGTGGGASTGGSMSTGGGTSTGGMSTGGDASTGGSASDPNIPSDTSEAGIEAWLDTGTYKTWEGDAAVRTVEPSTSPHGEWLRVYYSPIAMRSIRAGKNTFADGNEVGSIGIKEVYDAQGQQIGVMMAYRNLEEDGFDVSLYYCKAPGGLCAGTGSDTAYGQGTSECRGCHFNQFFSPFAVAAEPQD